MKLCSAVGCHDLPGSVAPCEMSSGIFADPMKTWMLFVAFLGTRKIHVMSTSWCWSVLILFICGSGTDRPWFHLFTPKKNKKQRFKGYPPWNCQFAPENWWFGTWISFWNGQNMQVRCLLSLQIKDRVVESLVWRRKHRTRPLGWKSGIGSWKMMIFWPSRDVFFWIVFFSHVFPMWGVYRNHWELIAE